MKNIFVWAIICAITASASLFISFGTHHTTEGAADSEIYGYAWSSNIGWISFNGSSYGVSIDQQAGTISGYAWSSNIGWISFNTSDLSGCPSNPCTAKLTGNTFSGWAKALAADGNGWDGWIHLSSGSNYGLTLNEDDSITGYMWGGPVVGWIKAKNLSTELQSMCENGLDDDGDGLADAVDPDCQDGNEEINPNPQCSNRYDDDGEGDIDYGNDPHCTSYLDNLEMDISEAPIVELKVGINSPAFDSLTLDKDGETVVLGIDIRRATTTTSCIRTVATLNNSSETTVSTGGAESYNTEQTLSITTGAKIIVSCTTDGKTGSDSVNILIKTENEF